MRTPTTIAVCLIAAATTLPVAAGDVYKCVTSNGTSYQSAPCARGDSQTRMTFAGPASAAAPAQNQAGYQAGSEAVVVAAAPVREQRTLRPGPWRHQTLTLGMSDDEVLNLPGWGRPARIARTRLPRAWQEVWTYGNAVTGERQLHFINARLSDIIDAPAAQVAMTLQ